LWRVKTKGDKKMIEYIIWGIPKGKTDEEVLITGLKTKAKAKEIITMFKNATDETKPWYGVSKVRLHILDLSEAPDFIGAIN